MRAVAAAAAALLVAACGSQDKNANGSAAGKAGDGAAGNSASAEAGGAGGAASGAQAMQPGQWEMVTQVTSVELPGAPPEAQAQLRAQQGQSRTDSRCITPEQAADPARDLVGSGQQSRNCQFSDRTFAGGVIRIHATCQQPGGPSRAEMSMEGRFTATTLEGTLTVNATGPNMTGGPGTQTLRASSTVRGRRIGECSARTAPPTVRVPVAPSPVPAPRP